MTLPSQLADAESSSSQEAGPIDFRAEANPEEEELDMTPMVDVTFLLLIFFMVTAAYSLQKAKEVPTPEQSEDAAQAQTLQDVEDNDDYVIVEIRRDDAIFVGDVLAPGEHDLLVKLREARRGPGGDSKGPSSLLVLADGDCRHETVVMVLDAGNEVGMENVRLASAEEVDF